MLNAVVHYNATWYDKANPEYSNRKTNEVTRFLEGLDSYGYVISRVWLKGNDIFTAEIKPPNISYKNEASFVLDFINNVYDFVLYEHLVHVRFSAKFIYLEMRIDFNAND